MDKGLYFDFWGTLWLPSAPEDVVYHVSLEATEQKICENLADAKIRFKRFDGLPAPGVCQAIPLLKDIAPLIIVSHTPSLAMYQMLQEWKLWGCFSAVVSAHQLGLSKTQVMGSTIEKTQTEPIAFIGDSLVDAKVASDLNLEYIHIGSEKEYASLGDTSHFVCYPTLIQALPDILERCRVAFDLPREELIDEQSPLEVLRLYAEKARKI